jgi:hypothetical protein
MKKISAKFKASVFGLVKITAAAAAAVAAAGIAIGAGLAYGAANAVKSFVDMGSALNDASARTGISVEALSEMGYAAEQAGASAEALETGIRKMQRTIVDAGSGSKEAIEALGQLGLKFMDLRDLSPQDQFKLIAARLNDIPDATARAGVAMQVLGKSGTQLIPMIAEVEELTKEFRDLGLTMSTKDAKAADQLGDRFGTLQAVMKRASVLMGASLAPAVERVTNSLIRAAASAAKWVDANRHSFRDAAIAAAKWLEWLGGKIKGFGESARSTLGGLGDAIMAGDFKTAGELAVLHLQSAFNGLRGFFSDLWGDMGKGLVDAYLVALAEIEKKKLKKKQLTNAIGDQIKIDNLTRKIDARQDDLAAKARGEWTSGERDSMGAFKETQEQIQKDIDELSKQRNDAMRQFEEGQKPDPAAVAAIDEQLQRDLDAAQKSNEARKKLGRAGTDAAQEQIDANIAKLNATAAAAREAAKWTPRVEDVKAWINDKGTLPPQDDLDDTVGDAVKKATATPRGTFSALQGLQGNDQLAKQELDLAKQTAKNTGDIAKAARKGLVVGA